MHDPVSLADGHTYERRYIKKWLQVHDTSPVSGAKLQSRAATPNHALRNSIEEYFSEVFGEHRRAIRRTVTLQEGEGLASNNALMRTIDAFLQCSMLMNADLSAEYVLRQIMEEARSLVGAEAVSVFLVDDARSCLFSTINSMGGRLEIPASAGIAGHVARAGRPALVDDAYKDSRFDSSVDAKTGFHTKSVLCVPLMAKQRGGVIGVVQLLNKTSSGQQANPKPAAMVGEAAAVAGVFSQDDLQLVQAFAFQAATALASSAGAGGVSLLDDGDEAEPRRLASSCPTAPASSSAHVAVSRQASSLRIVRPGSKAAEMLSEAFNSWRLDAIHLSEVCANRPLSALANYLFEHTGILGHFGMDRDQVARFFAQMERGYDDSIPYHNRRHAASVMHLMHAMLLHTELTELVAPVLGCDPKLAVLSGLLAAAVHDYQHEGVTNDFLVQTFDDRAVQHNDEHVNERHHISAAFQVLKRPEFNFMSVLSDSDFRLARKMAIAMVLGTDMADHGFVMKEFQTLLEATGTAQSGAQLQPKHSFRPRTPDEAILLLQVAMKCADLGHLTLDWENHVAWVRLLETELFAQGDREKALGWSKISLFTDRDKGGVSSSQRSFFDFVVLPMFRATMQALPSSQPLMDAVNENYVRWKACEADAAAQGASGVAPPKTSKAKAPGNTAQAPRENTKAAPVAAAASSCERGRPPRPDLHRGSSSSVVFKADATAPRWGLKKFCRMVPGSSATGSSSSGVGS